MKITESKLEKEAINLAYKTGIGMGSILQWERLATHVLRRIAAAERRGYKRCQQENWKRFTTKP